MYTRPRIYSRNVCTILRRAPGSVYPLGSRAIHLLHALWTRHLPISSDQLDSITKKAYPHAKKVSLKLLEGPGNGATTMTLSEALKRLEPCSYLAQVEKHEAYRIQKFPDPKSGPRPKGPEGPEVGPHPPPKYNEEYPGRPYHTFDTYYKRRGLSKEIHFNTASCTAGFLRHRLTLAYRFLLDGTRVEIHLHPTSLKETDTVDWALEHSLHLRPDSILAAMPKGTTMLVLPCCTDMSFKRKVPKKAKKVELSKSVVMWAMENAGAVWDIHKTSTPQEIERIGKWHGWIGDEDARKNADLTPETSLDSLLDKPPDETPAKSNFTPYVAER